MNFHMACILRLSKRSLSSIKCIRWDHRSSTWYNFQKLCIRSKYWSEGHILLGKLCMSSLHCTLNLHYRLNLPRCIQRNILSTLLCWQCGKGMYLVSYRLGNLGWIRRSKHCRQSQKCMFYILLRRSDMIHLGFYKFRQYKSGNLLG